MQIDGPCLGVHQFIHGQVSLGNRSNLIRTDNKKTRSNKINNNQNVRDEILQFFAHIEIFVMVMVYLLYFETLDLISNGQLKFLSF